MASLNDAEYVVRKKYIDLTLDLNLDTKTAEDAWKSYEIIKQSYTLEVN